VSQPNAHWTHPKCHRMVRTPVYPDVHQIAQQMVVAAQAAKANKPMALVS